MSSLEQQQRELEDVQSIRFVTGTLLEVSAERIKKLRDRFERNQLFFSEISEIYAVVKWSATERHELKASSPERKRRLAVAFTSNSRFYGSLNRMVIDTFVKETGTDASRSRLVVGTVGERLMETTPLRKRSSYTHFRDDQPTPEEIRRLLHEFEPYDEIVVYYPQFINVFTQEIGVLDMTHNAPPSSEAERVEYLFEPELSKILLFFETRVRHLLLERVMLESELARTAARLTTMNRAEDRATQEATSIRHAILREHQTLDSLRLLESLSGRVRWKTATGHNS